jgi:hypothetical protein
MLEATVEGADADASAQCIRGLLNEATATLDRLQDDLQSAMGRGGAAVDWLLLLTRVEGANVPLLQVLARLEQPERQHS